MRRRTLKKIIWLIGVVIPATVFVLSLATGGSLPIVTQWCLVIVLGLYGTTVWWLE